jgi:hypothetical protein
LSNGYFNAISGGTANESLNRGTTANANMVIDNITSFNMNDLSNNINSGGPYPLGGVGLDIEDLHD